MRSLEWKLVSRPSQLSPGTKRKGVLLLVDEAEAMNEELSVEDQGWVRVTAMVRLGTVKSCSRNARTDVQFLDTLSHPLIS